MKLCISIELRWYGQSPSLFKLVAALTRVRLVRLDVIRFMHLEDYSV